MDDENTFIDSDGVGYEAVPVDESEDGNVDSPCERCEVYGNCWAVKCTATERQDHREVYWTKLGAAARKTIEPVRDPNPL